MIGGVVNAHVAVKFIYVRMFRGTGSMHTRSFTARAAWAAICAALWALSWIIAEGIPIFNDVLGLAVCAVQASSVEPKDIWLMPCNRVLSSPAGFPSVFRDYSGSI